MAKQAVYDNLYARVFLRLRACLYEVGWPVSELARQQANPVLYEGFESEPASSQPGY